MGSALKALQNLTAEPTQRQFLQTVSISECRCSLFLCLSNNLLLKTVHFSFSDYQDILKWLNSRSYVLTQAGTTVSQKKYLLKKSDFSFFLDNRYLLLRRRRKKKRPKNKAKQITVHFTKYGVAKLDSDFFPLEFVLLLAILFFIIHLDLISGIYLSCSVQPLFLLCGFLSFA